MKLLVFDTSTEVLSIAVQSGDETFEYSGTGGAQASARLIPEIQILMGNAGLALQDLDGIAFSAGPGVFTGLRASCAVAQGLGFGANVPLLPINTLHAVAFSIVAIAFYPVLAWLLVPFTLLVAASRVVLGLHYPSDVLAGAALGALIARGALAL